MAQTIELALTNCTKQIVVTSSVSVEPSNFEDELAYEEIKEDISDTIMKHITIKKKNIPESGALIYETNFTLII